jgi:hypothetical protein
MADRPDQGKRNSLDPEPLSLGRRATFRRVLAVLKSQPAPFVLAGAVGLSLRLGRVIDGDLEVYMRAADVPPALDVVHAAGLRVEVDDTHARARITYGENRIVLRWGLPLPLSGEIDDAWFHHSSRTHFLGLRVKIAPIEELLWLKIAIPSGASVGDPLIPQLLLACGEEMDWSRLLLRLAGLEALLLAHIFLFWHQYPESARATIPEHVIDLLRNRMSQAAGESQSQ